MDLIYLDLCKAFNTAKRELTEENKDKLRSCKTKGETATEKKTLPGYISTSQGYWPTRWSNQDKGVQDTTPYTQQNQGYIGVLVQATGKL